MIIGEHPLIEALENAAKTFEDLARRLGAKDRDFLDTETNPVRNPRTSKQVERLKEEVRAAGQSPFSKTARVFGWLLWIIAIATIIHAISVMNRSE